MKSKSALDEFLCGPLPAMLVCRDRDTRKWGRRWLEREGFQVAVVDAPDDILQSVRSIEPRVIIVEGGLCDSTGKPVLETLAADAEGEVPLIALSNGSRDLEIAIDAGVHDIARKPFEWKIIARRAKTAARIAGLEQDLGEARGSLADALRVAEGARQRLRSQESFEPITGLPNKRRFLNLLIRGMHAVDRDESVLAVVVIGLNRFRLVVEAMGQENADLVLAETGKRVTSFLGNIGRFQAGTPGLHTAAAATTNVDRFALMLTSSGDEGELADLQQQLIGQLSQPVNITGQTVHLSASSGLALYPQDATDADSLLQRAENAMRDAQARGGGFKFYCTETDAAAARKLRIEHMLHEALENHQLELAFQPLVRSAGAKLSAAEALLRWPQPDGSAIPPGEFVPIAEESGLMHRLGAFVLDEACRQLRVWRDAGVKLPRICVNVSRAQLIHSQFADVVQEALQAHRLEPSRLELELSERGALSGDVAMIRELEKIRTLGVRLSIDDFGTGDSAIAYLKELPIDVLKIDRSYIKDLPGSRRDASIVSAMVAMGHALDLEIVAEGVETREQFALVRDLGCDECQGYYFSRPVDRNAFAKLLNKPA